ncbi:MAG TPA: sigma-54 dependent transcriptional regulator [Blastocatellia bacterium]|jgi:DNA-binding NtrC family response regulator|nr:sigma-54 dependent transcriptional regulator [Blastocatellia bacterium]
MAEILLVEDKESLRQMLRLTLQNSGYSVEEACDGAEARRKLNDTRYNLVITDLKMPRADGLEVLRAAKAADADSSVILLTAYGTIDEAVQAMKEGACEFLQKPVDSHQLLSLVQRAIESARLRAENVLLRDEYARHYGFPRIIGDSSAMQKVGREIQQVAATQTTALLLGESGTGKELFARAIHHLSPRRQAPFVALNCAAIPDTLIENELFGHEKGAYTGADHRRVGKFELAARGTIFLDEISEVAPSVQSKLLRVLEERKIARLGGSSDIEVDVRVIAATNRDLKAAVAAREFREDLYFRLAVFPVHIPALRERRSDIRQLAEFFAAKYGRELRRSPLRLTEESLRLLEEYDWPGNVRELENCLERACILAQGLEITPGDLNISPPSNYSPQEQAALLDGFDLRGTLSDVSTRAQRLVERRKIDATLKECGYNKSRTAERLGVSYKTLLTRIKELELE